MATGNRRHHRCGFIRSSSPEKGFTLMEVMVALSVVAIALTAVYRMHSQTLFMDARSRFDTVAAMLARQRLADIDTADLADLTGDSGDFGDLYPGYAWRVETEEVSSDLLTDNGPALKRIVITVSLNDTEASFNLTTYRHLYE
jgi:general secretion pathway protein I